MYIWAGSILDRWMDAQSVVLGRKATSRKWMWSLTRRYIYSYMH